MSSYMKRLVSPADKTTDEAGRQADRPSKDSWMNLTNETDSESDGDELFESPKQGPIACNEVPSPIITAKDGIEQELAELRMDRDALRQQLSEARAELKVARSTLRENEHQLRNIKQSERRQTELEENALLEEEIDKLARLAREQEEKEQGSQDGTKDSLDTISSDGAVKFPVVGKIDENASTVLTQEERAQNMRVEELERALEERKVREHNLWQQVRKLKEQARVESKKYEESQRQVQWFQKELKAMFPQDGDASSVSSSEDNIYGEKNNWKNRADDNQDNAAHLETIIETKNVGDEQPTDNHLKLLHKQRLELERRIQDLLSEIGTLRLGQKTYQDEKQQSDAQVQQLQTALQEQQEQHRLELVLVERQLEEWKGRSDSFQTDLKEGRNLAEHLDAQSQFERRERQRLSQRVEELEVEKNELKDSLEKSRIDFEHERGYLKRAMESLEDNLKKLTAESETKNGYSDVLEQADDESSKLLLDRIQALEEERESSITLERELREQLENSTEQEKLAKNEAAASEERVRVLQTYLDASFSASPKKERQQELQQEYLSVHGEDQADEEKPTENQLYEASSQGTEKPTNDIDSDLPTSAEVVEVNPDSNKAQDDAFFDAQQKPNDLSTLLGGIRSPESPVRTQKLPEIDEQSVTSDAVVHNLHLKLEAEMGNLKKRKEKRRSRTVSSGRPNELRSTTSMEDEQDWDNEQSEYYHLGQTEKSTADDESLKKMEEENSRLGTALETANYKKAQLEIELGDALQKINDSTSRIETLTAEIVECRSSLKVCEKEKSDLTERIDVARNETAILKSDLSKIGEEKKSMETNLLNLKETLDAKDKLIAKNDECHRIQLWKMKEELEEAHRASDEDATRTKQISELEAKILLMQNESKANVELLSKNLDGVLEERNALELKLRDACKELDECRESEAELREAAQGIIEKLESAQVDIEKLSQSKALENSKWEKQISEKEQRIADLEGDLSTKGKRLEQAAIQLSELENELFERDEELKKLDAKRVQIQENAAKQLSEMENLLAKDGDEIDRLQEEKSKLQELVQQQEHQIEKQVGRLVEASSQLSELESELFAKDEEIEEMEMRINAVQALAVQRMESSQDPEAKTKSVADDKKAKEILSQQSQLDRQLQTVSKLTEQNDKWQLQLEKAYEEKQELLDSLSALKAEMNTLEQEVQESNQTIKELNSINIQLKEDLVCATEEDEKNRIRISHMEEQKEALSQKLESTLDNLAELLKQNEEVRELDERLSTGIIDQLQANFQSAQAVDVETENLINNLKAQVEFERQSLQTSELKRNELESENEILKKEIQLFSSGMNAKS